MEAVPIRISLFTTIDLPRLLPGHGHVTVRTGQRVNPEDVLAVGNTYPEHIVLDIAKGLGIRKESAAKYIVCQQDTAIIKGDLIAGPVGLTKRVIRSPQDGRVVLIQEHIVLLEKKQSNSLTAYLPGEIKSIVHGRGAIIHSQGAIVQGIWGNGKITFGTLKKITPELETREFGLPAENLQDTIIYLSYCGSQKSLRTIIDMSPGGVILGGLPQSLIPMVKDVEFPFLVLVGFGKFEVDQQIRDILSDHDGKPITMNANQWNPYSGIRPEVIIPLQKNAASTSHLDSIELKPGKEVRVINSGHHGRLGVLKELVGQTILPNGVRAETAMVKFSDGTIEQIPLLNLEVVIR